MSESGSQGPNADQAAHWKGEAGARWVRLQAATDLMLRPFGERAMDAARIVPGQHALDIGAGCGATTIELARRVGTAGRVHAVDLSDPMLGSARERAACAGLANVTFQVCDVQQDPIEHAPHDVAVSRFGIMFFDDPVTAFSRLRGALRPGGRFAACTWRAREENPMFTLPAAAAKPHLPMPPSPDPHAPGPFGLWDRERTLGLLCAAGWSDVAIDPFDSVLRLGEESTLEAALHYIENIGPLATLLAEADADTRARALAAIAEALAPHHRSDGVTLPGATWIVSAVA